VTSSQCGHWIASRPRWPGLDSGAVSVMQS
jgi:hypothetical protein